MAAEIDETKVSSLDDLEKQVAELRQHWSDFHELMAEGVIARGINSERVYRAGTFQLLRFMTDLDPAQENHIGEAILRADGTVEYLKTYRLSAAQARRAFLLSQLASHNWNLDATAAKLRQTKADLMTRLEKAGFGYLLMEHVLAAARRRKR
jgi:hypothetical protein